MASYYWPSIVQLVLFALVALLSGIQAIYGIVWLVRWGYWAGIGAIIHGILTLGYSVFVYQSVLCPADLSLVCHKRSHVTLVSTKFDVILSFVFGVTGLFIGIFCGLV